MFEHDGQETTPIREDVDLASLTRWINRAYLDRLRPSGEKCDRQITSFRQFGFGQSNPTFKVTMDGNRVFVLRKKPSRVVHASAHALDREYAMLERLAAHNASHPRAIVPVPRVYAYCSNTTVIGTEFYLQEFSEGRIYTNPADMPNKRAAILACVCVLANLHSVATPQQQQRSRRMPFATRQLRALTLIAQKQAAELKDDSAVAILRVADQLRSHTPPTHAVTLIHGDYKLDNFVFCNNDMHIRAVLDWELSSTAGDPWTDLAQLCSVFLMDSTSSPLVKGWKGCNDAPLRREVVWEYCQRRAATSSPTVQAQYLFETIWAWSGYYLALACFRNAVIVQGVAQRAQAGVASSAQAGRAAEILPVLLLQAQQVLQHHPPPQATLTTLSRL